MLRSTVVSALRRLLQAALVVVGATFLLSLLLRLLPVGLEDLYVVGVSETDRAAFGSLREYGLAVIAELEAAGVPGPQIVALGSLAGKAQFEGAARFGEAAALVPFSEVRRGRLERPSSEPAPATAATPGSRKRSTGGSK